MAPVSLVFLIKIPPPTLCSNSSVLPAGSPVHQALNMLCNADSSLLWLPLPFGESFQDHPEYTVSSQVSPTRWEQLVTYLVPTLSPGHRSNPISSLNTLLRKNIG